MHLLHFDTVHRMMRDYSLKRFVKYFLVRGVGGGGASDHSVMCRLVFRPGEQITCGEQQYNYWKHLVVLTVCYTIVLRSDDKRSEENCINRKSQWKILLSELSVVTDRVLKLIIM
jgi:hypothetical protein